MIFFSATNKTKAINITPEHVFPVFKLKKQLNAKKFYKIKWSKKFATNFKIVIIFFIADFKNILIMSSQRMYFQSSFKKHFTYAAAEYFKYLQNLTTKIHLLQKISRVSFIGANKLWVKCHFHCKLYR